MDCSKVGNLILSLRKEKGLTQKALADSLMISHKTVSKWERGQGCPDVSLLPELAQALGVEIEKILIGELGQMDPVGGNMKKIKFYVCPACGNLLTSTGEATLSCCGRRLEPLTASKADDGHQLVIETCEDELYISSAHEMTKEHSISFAAYVTGDKLFMVKQYPEWGMQFRFRKYGRGLLYFHCTRHGLFYQMI